MKRHEKLLQLSKENARSCVIMDTSKTQQVSLSTLWMPHKNQTT